jgi:hypothetical protein
MNDGGGETLSKSLYGLIFGLVLLLALSCTAFAGNAFPYAVSSSGFSGKIEQNAGAEALDPIFEEKAAVVPYPLKSDLYEKSLYVDESYTLPYAIIVDRVNQVITIVSMSEPGRYGVIEQQFICSTGASGTPTPAGRFTLANATRKEWRFFPTAKCYIRYATRIFGDYFFHSILYNRATLESLNSTSYRNLGRRASHGCIRMLDEDVHWLSDHCGPGTIVWIMDGERDEALNLSLKPNPYVSTTVRDFGRYDQYK